MGLFHFDHRTISFLSALICFSILTTTKGSAQTGGFIVRQNYELEGLNLYGIVVGDLNQDGMNDILIGTDRSNEPIIQPLIAKTDGSYEVQADIALNDDPRFLFAEDLDRDGNLDLIYTALGSDTVWISMGLGPMQFAEPEMVQTGNSLTSVAVTPFDDDPYPDLIVCRYQSGVPTELRIYINNGDGTFKNPGVQPIDGHQIFAEDIDLDAHQDLVILDHPGKSITVMLGDGAGSVSSTMDYAIPIKPNSIGSGDLSGDGWTDLLIVESGRRTYAFLPGTGPGLFGAPVESELPISAKNGASPRLDLIDKTKDGRLDLVYLGYEVSGLIVLEGNGDGNFIDYDSFPVIRGAYDMISADLGGGGSLDFVTVSQRNFSWGFGPKVSVLLDDDARMFRAARTYQERVFESVMTMGDFNSDGNQDVVTGTLGDHYMIKIIPGQDERFTTATLYDAGTITTDPEAADFDGDGLQDLAYVTRTYASDPSSTRSLVVLFGDGNFGFSDEIVYNPEWIPTGLQVGYFNNDERPDLAVMTYDSVSSYSMEIYLNNGDRTFSFLGGMESPGGYFSETHDMDGDGITDLLWADFQEQIHLFRGNGDGTFHAAETLTLNNGDSSIAMTIGDFDNNGIPDLAVAYFSSGNVTVSLGLGNGTYAEDIAYEVGRSPKAIETADFNGDGNADIIVSHELEDSYVMFLGDGVGNFPERVDVPAGVSPDQFKLVDLGNDGDLDLVGLGGEGITVVVNEGRAGNNATSWNWRFY